MNNKQEQFNFLHSLKKRATHTIRNKTTSSVFELHWPNSSFTPKRRSHTLILFGSERLKQLHSLLGWKAFFQTLEAKNKYRKYEVKEKIIALNLYLDDWNPSVWGKGIKKVVYTVWRQHMKVFVFINWQNLTLDLTPLICLVRYDFSVFFRKAALLVFVTVSSEKAQEQKTQRELSITQWGVYFLTYGQSQSVSTCYFILFKAANCGFLFTKQKRKWYHSSCPTLGKRANGLFHQIPQFLLGWPRHD